jgi:hypothetical protein
MKRFDCHSSLRISCHSYGDAEALERTLYIHLKHSKQHVHYYDVAMPPGAAALIRQHVEWATPADMVTKVQKEFPNVTRAQVHDAWSRMSEVFWRKEEKQMPSAIKLLAEFPNEVDEFTPHGVPDGVEILCWGMKLIVRPLTTKGTVIEVALDATCKTQYPFML